MVHTHTKTIAIIAALILLVSVSAFVGFAYFTEGHKTEFKRRSEERALAEAQRAELNDLIRVVQSTSKERDELSSRILSEKDIIIFVELVESAAREQGVEMTTKNIVEEPKNDLFEALKITFEAQGSYDALMHMLRVMEALPYQSSVDTVRMASSGEESNASWKATFEIVVTKFLTS